jgi:hypothetical protein
MRKFGTSKGFAIIVRTFSFLIPHFFFVIPS